jgi:quinol monooxygenase YgiN
MTDIGVVAKIVAKQGKEQDLLAELRRMVEPTRKEPGCLKYVLHTSSTNPCEFWFVEEWTSRDALEKHTQTPHYRELKQRTPDFTASSEVVVLDPIADT